MLRNPSVLRNIAFAAIAALALGSATLATPALARGGGGGGGGGHGGGGGGGHFGGGMGGGHFGGGFGGGFRGGAGFGGARIGGMSGGMSGLHAEAPHAGQTHVGGLRQRGGDHRFRRGFGNYDNGFGYDDCYLPGTAQFDPYCEY